MLPPQSDGVDGLPSRQAPQHALVPLFRSQQGHAAMNFKPSNVHVIAESLGLKVQEEAARALAPDVEYRLREIIQVCTKRASSCASQLLRCPFAESCSMMQA